jgi:hypothetical protein
MEAYVVRKNGQPVEQETISTSGLARPPRHRRATDAPGARGVELLAGAAAG